MIAHASRQCGGRSLAGWPLAKPPIEMWPNARAAVVTTFRLTVAVVILCITVFVPIRLNARDDGRFANSPLKEWFDRLASRNGLCCAFADGVSVQDVDWDHRRAIIVSAFMENGLWCLTRLW